MKVALRGRAAAGTGRPTVNNTYAMIALTAFVFALQGAEPVGGVIDGGDALYGSASAGGTHCIPTSINDWHHDGCGVVYRVRYDGSGYTVLHAFDGTDGKAPWGTLLLGPDGRLYGRTQFGGPHDAGVIYSISRDGSQFRVLDDSAKPALDVPSLAMTSNGDVYAALAQGEQSSVLRIRGATSERVEVSAARIGDLRAESDSVYVLLSYPRSCGSEIRRIDTDARITTTFTDRVAFGMRGCEGVTSLNRILPLSDGSVYAISYGGFERITGSTTQWLYRIPRQPPGHTVLQRIGVPTTLSQTSDGIAIGMSPAASLNCGTVLAISANGEVIASAIFPFDKQFNDVVGCMTYDPHLTVRGSHVYGTTPGFSCATAESGSGSPLTCGSIFDVVAGVARTIYAFGPALRIDPLATAPPRRFSEVLQTTSDPHRYVLTSVDDMDATRGFAARTPAPIPVAFRSVAAKAALSMVFEGTTVAHDVFRPLEAPIPGLAYRAPDVRAGMYDLGVSINGRSSRLYVPRRMDGVRPIAPGQAFLALGGLLAESPYEAMTDLEGLSLGTSRVVLRAHSSGKFSFRVADSGETLEFSGQYRDAQSIPGLTLITQDDVSRRAQSELAGKTVYPKALSGVCMQLDGSTTNMTFYDATLQVREVYRLSGVAPTLSIDGSGGDYAAFTSVDPLVITFQTPLQNRQTFASGDGATITSDPRDCVGFYALAADPWHVARMLSLRPRVNPAWPPDIRAAVERRTVLVGMTRDMVAASIGYPPIYGTAEDFAKMDDWRYDAAPPYGQDVVFSDGRVVKYDPPGMLP